MNEQEIKDTMVALRVSLEVSAERDGTDEETKKLVFTLLTLVEGLLVNISRIAARPQ